MGTGQYTGKEATVFIQPFVNEVSRLNEPNDESLLLSLLKKLVIKLPPVDGIDSFAPCMSTNSVNYFEELMIFTFNGCSNLILFVT